MTLASLDFYIKARIFLSDLMAVLCSVGTVLFVMSYIRGRGFLSHRRCGWAICRTFRQELWRASFSGHPFLVDAVSIATLGEHGKGFVPWSLL